MRKVYAIACIAVLAAGCQQSSTPLVHALAAFRAGDHDDFVKAKAEAEEAAKTALQPGGDLCRANMMDVEKYGTLDVIEKLDHPDLFKMTEEQKLVYALALAGKHLTVKPGSFLSTAPIFQIGTDHDGARRCGGQKDVMVAALLGAGGEAQAANEARMDYLHGWMRDLRARDGTDFDRRMRFAASYLENYTAYSARWPAEIDFIDE